jgi:hypothetical protein
MTAYTCLPDSGKSTASYQGGSIQCQLNRCTCENGYGNNGTECPVNGTANCGRCAAGYFLQSATGQVTSATCKPTPCDAGTAPKYGTVGNCPSTLESGSTCQPGCKSGWYSSGATSCTLGTLTPSTCLPHLQCELTYQKGCSDNTGYWSKESQYLDYPGCETYCNMMHSQNGNVQGCELAKVDSSVRTTNGIFCLVHTKGCNLIDSTDGAAASCTVSAQPNATHSNGAGLSHRRKKAHPHSQVHAAVHSVHHRQRQAGQ